MCTTENASRIRVYPAFVALYLQSARSLLQMCAVYSVQCTGARHVVVLCIIFSKYLINSFSVCVYCWYNYIYYYIIDLYKGYIIGATMFS